MEKINLTVTSSSDSFLAENHVQNIEVAAIPIKSPVEIQPEIVKEIVPEIPLKDALNKNIISPLKINDDASLQPVVKHEIETVSEEISHLVLEVADEEKNEILEKVDLLPTKSEQPEIPVIEKILPVAPIVPAAADETPTAPQTPAEIKPQPLNEKNSEKASAGIPGIFEEETQVEAETEPPVKKGRSPRKTTPDLFGGNPTIADKFKEEKKSINEVISVKGDDKSIAAKIKKNPVKDIKAAVGINEKFKMINQLFEGNLQSYTESISMLNEFSNFEDAKKYVEFLKTEFNWDDSLEAYIALMDLVSRRYM